MEQLAYAHRVWVDGMETGVVPADDRGLAFGDGLFETMRRCGAKIPLLDRHLRRLGAGAQRLRIPVDIDQLRDEVTRFAEEAGPGDDVLKLVVTRGSGTPGYLPGEGGLSRRILMQRPRAEHPVRWWSEGVRVRYCETRLGLNAVLGGIKHLNRLEQVMARMEWSDPEVADGLMSDPRGRIVEGVCTNLFLVSGARLLTPVIANCGVSGVMRGFILEAVARELALQSAEIQCERATIAAAQEVFLCNAVVGVWPVRQLDTRTWPVGPVTRRVQAHVAQVFSV